jgi:hypothetical protein
MAAEVEHNRASDYTSKVSTVDPTLVTDKELEVMAGTLALEHAAAEKAKTRMFVGSSTESDAAARPPTFAMAAPYEDRGEIARGGMGAVRRAFDKDLHRQVAIKVMLPTLRGGESVAQRFVDEARITALIDHPNIAPVYRLARAEDGSLSLVMKLIEGQSFTSHLRSLPAPPWAWSTLDSLLSVLVKVCDAVAFAHSRGVIHLDLKPDNIMLGTFGQVYVVDWGIARYQPPTEHEATLKTLSPRDASTGTPVYMSPEQALRIESHISELTDVFLLGGILYEILTGRRPHEGQNLQEILTSAIRGVVEPPALRAPYRQIHPALADIAMKALAARPQDRYQSVLDLQRDIVAFQRGEERAPRRAYEAGSVIVREGEPGNEAFVIVSGKCAVTTTVDGKRVVLRELGPGEVFGETAVFSDEPRTATVEATETLVLRVVTGETLSQSLGLQTWTGEFVKALAERFREADRRARE